MNFNALIGNEKVKQDFIKMLNQNHVTHSYMLIGTKGIGKKEFAKEFAKGILCSNHHERPCQTCKSCMAFEDSNHPDYNEINLQEENSIKIDTIRQMQRKVQELPILSEKKVYIIDDSECMTKDAQNCLLKTLEEPPEFVTILLIVSDENKMLNTIKSRCLKIYFQALSDAELKQYIAEHFDLYTFSENMITACEGSIGKAKKIAENKEIYTQLDHLFGQIEGKKLVDVYPQMDLLYKNKENIQDILEYCNVLFLQKAMHNQKYLPYIEAVEKTKNNLNLNCNYDMCIDQLLFQLFER